ncbi:MAG: MotA/TolQ/ExbB proton channel family protein [Pseudomonadota bacterium]|nr:MotA/TolQ/ExbB proton channel family protein [Pseudomonadota bacterium]
MLEQKVLALALTGTTGILWLLVALSVVCLAVAIERGIVLWLAGRGAASVDRAVGRFAADADPKRLAAALGVVETSSTRVLLAALAALPHGAATVDEEITSELITERARLERGLAILGTTGSNAPFIGLLGTVLGIVRAFHELAANTSAGNSTVMAGISESLVATAVGLVVAIPAVVLYNVLQRRVRAVLAHAEAAAHRVSGRARSTSEDRAVAGPRLVP